MLAFDLSMLALSLLVILASSLLFTNAVEFLGHRLSLHQGTVGSILAAVGTAMPETIIPIIAFIAFRDSGTAIAIGAIAGAPFMLATLAMLVTGVGVFVYHAMRRRPLAMTLNSQLLRRDMSYFVVIYAAAIGAAFVPWYWLQVAIGAGLLGCYVLYIRKTMASDVEQVNMDEPLMLNRYLKLQPSMFWIQVQLLGSLALMVAAAHQFVNFTAQASHAIGISELVLSIIITPIATELPEKFNSVVWVGKRKDILAMGNISGAMVFQSCVPVFFGIAFNRWHSENLGAITMLSAGLAIVSALVIVGWMRLRGRLSAAALLSGGLFYAVFLVYVFAVR